MKILNCSLMERAKKIEFKLEKKKNNKNHFGHSRLTTKIHTY